MAYRRRQGMTPRSGADPYSPSSPSLAAQAIRASAAHHNPSKASPTYDYTSMTSSNEGGGFWGVVARKAKTILELEQDQTDLQFHPAAPSSKMDNPRFRKGLDAITSSLNHIGDTIGNALEEGREDTRRLQGRRRGEEQHQHLHATPEDQLKASRDVAMATAAKAKLLLRELKTVKADLAFAKQRCSQLEEENRMLRESREKGDNPADDDMIRLQLETLLAEKARLAHENSVYARENRFLREIIEYHQLTMQDVVYVDEGIEEITEVYPIPAVSRMLSASPPSPASPESPSPPSPTPIINSSQHADSSALPDVKLQVSTTH